VPIYRYRCEDGHENETIRPMEKRNDEFPCPEQLRPMQPAATDEKLPCGKPTKLAPPTGVSGKVIGGTPKFH